MNMDINKQYINIGDKPVLARTVSVFEECPIVNEIILVINEEEIFYCKENIVDKFAFKNKNWYQEAQKGKTQYIRV